MMDELIARLEKATGPDRELDALLGAACAVVDDFDPLWFTVPALYVGDERGTIRIYAGKVDPSVRHHKYSRKARLFTASIDAALTLVPEGWSMWFGINGNKGATASVCSNWNDDHAPTFQSYDRRPRERGQLPPEETFCANAAIALCIAALKARQSLIDPQRGK